VAGWWFSLGTLVSSTNKTDRHDIAQMQNDHQQILGFYFKKTSILKFRIFERYIDFYFKSNFDAVFFL